MPPTHPRSRRPARAAWLAPLLVLAGVVAALGFLRTGPVWIFGWVFGVGLAGILGWIAVSVFWPAAANRICPGCGRRSVERADPSSARGLVCRACGWSEPDESAWLLAEEEGPLERIVLAGRARGQAPVDSPGQAGDTLGRPRADSEARA